MKIGFNKLKEGIFIEDRLDSSDIEKLSKHRDCKNVQLTRLKLKDIEFLLYLENMEELKLYECEVDNYTALSRLQNLKSLVISNVKKEVDNFSVLSDLINLEKLGIMHIPQFYKFPDLSKCVSLRQLTIMKCRNLADISDIKSIPNLQLIHTSGLPLKPADFEFLMSKPTLQEMWCGFDTKKMELEFDTLWKPYKEKK